MQIGNTPLVQLKNTRIYAKMEECLLPYFKMI